MSFTISIPDALRRSVEAASKGRNTVVYTAKGQPCFMYVLRKFNVETIDASLGSGVHPAFVIDGVEKDAILIGMYGGAEVDGELVSQPGRKVRHTLSHDNSIALVRQNGAGHHLVTNAEWSAIGLRCWKDGFQPNGNSGYGRSSDDTTEFGVSEDGVPLPNAGGERILSGSGPTTWRHDNTPFGIADLNGNVWEWTPGMRIDAGEIHVIADNDAAMDSTSFAVGSAAWRAIDGSNGDLVAPGHANAVKYATSGTADYTLVRASGASFEGMTNPGGTPVSTAALQRLKAIGLFPVAASGLRSDSFTITMTSERMPLRGGYCTYGALAGVFALNLNISRSSTSALVGCRPAFAI